MLIANTSLGYRSWLRDGLGSRSTPACITLPPPTPRASYVNIDGQVRAFVLGGIYGI
jgi:hypothetical protein